MSIMARYARIFWAEPSDTDVGARNASVSMLRDLFAAIGPGDAVDVARQLSEGLRTGRVAGDLSASVEDAITASSPAFTMNGNELQGIVCACVAALELVRATPVTRDGAASADAMAAALWSALSLQDPTDNTGLEGLRQDLIENSRKRVLQVARVTRERHVVPDVGNLSLPETNPTSGRAQTAYKRATAPVVKALKDNSDLDREELDFLWWALSDHSRIFDRPLSQHRTMSRAVTAGIEAARMLRRLPDDGHRHVALRLVEKGPEVTLAELLRELSDEVVFLSDEVASIHGSPDAVVYPLLSALREGGLVSGTGVKLDARGWGSRALLEVAIATIVDRNGVRK